ncbi:MAG TPA: hypothetical protein ENI99_04935 [Sedimenticola sp.]|nr:hypothetical protein [Sedimenticola sp.]
MSGTIYFRVEIHGELEVRSPLHVGHGEVEKLEDERCHRPDDPAAKLALKETDWQYQRFFSDGEDRITLPGSTVRGNLRALARDLLNGDAVFEELFGPDEIEEAGQAGRLRVRDAPLIDGSAGTPATPFWHPQRQTGLQRSTAIDPVTGTAREKHLFGHEVAPPESRFEATLELHEVTEKQLKKFLGLLKCWQGDIGRQMGARRSRGFGRIAWQGGEVKVAQPDTIKQWFDNGELEAELPLSTTTLEPNELGEKSARMTIAYTLTTLSPLLVGEPGLVREKPEEADIDLHDYPGFEYARAPDGKPLIPGTSLAGLWRAQGRRILATLRYLKKKREAGITPKQAADWAEEQIQQLFGGEERQSRIWFGDGKHQLSGAGTTTTSQQPETDYPSPPEGYSMPALKPWEHLQYFNAIDRFSGAVAGEKGEGKLYSVKGVAPGTRFGGQILIADRGPLEPWMKGLLALILRDIQDGELPLGWGKNRGYGEWRMDDAGEKGFLRGLNGGERSDDKTKQGSEPEQAFDATINDWITALNDHAKE